MVVIVVVFNAEGKPSCQGIHISNYKLAFHIPQVAKGLCLFSEYNASGLRQLFYG